MNSTIAFVSCLAAVQGCVIDPEGVQNGVGGLAGTVVGGGGARGNELSGGGGQIAGAAEAAASGGPGDEASSATDASGIGDGFVVDGGFGRDDSGSFDSSVERGPVRANLPKDIIYVSLGDSITNGWNAGVTCQDWPSTPQPFPTYCGDGNSYVVDVARGVTAANHTVSVVNPAQPSKRIGYVVQVELAEIPSNANLVSLYIGTNDWRDIANAGSEQAIQDGIRAFQGTYDGVLTDIAKKAPNAIILLLNVPNQKYVNEGSPADQLDRYDRVSVELDQWINGHSDKYIVIDNVCDPRTYQKPFRGSNVHPNTAGHQLIADRIVNALSGQPAPLPARSCAPYLP